VNAARERERVRLRLPPPAGAGEYLLLHRAPARGGFWQSVSGRIEPGEKADAAARREVKEETAPDPVRVICLEKVNVFYNVALEAIHFEPCFGVEVAVGEPVLSNEHDAHRWVDGDRRRTAPIRWSPRGVLRTG